MTSEIISSKEKIVMGRNRFTNAIYLATLAIMLIAVVLSWQRTDTFEQERASAAADDREVWINQGERNPHSAAHFSRYAFKPIPSMSTFEPGSLDYSGLAVWMEAHRRNPAAFRYAEGAGDLSNFVSLTPAWIMQVILPLVIILLLFSSYAGEREDGTLRQLLSHGISLKSVFRGKIRAALYTVLKLLIPLAFIIMAAVVVIQTGAQQADQILRLFILLGVYSLYFMIFAFISIGVSARSGSRRSSAIALFTVWFVLIIVAPRFASDAATFSIPQPKGFEVNKSLSEARAAYSKDEAYQEQSKQKILDKYGVNEISDLPINYRGYILQTSEEHADPYYDEVYSDLRGIHEGQETILEILSFMSPTTALKQLSAGLAGTDRIHHDAFAWDAELHRRNIIKQMNEDLMINGIVPRNSYTTGEELWSQIADYQGKSPLFLSLISYYISMFGVLIAMTFLAYLFARRATLRIDSLEAIK